MASDAAGAMKPLAGNMRLSFRRRAVQRSLFAASILPLSTAYTVCEGMGFESGLDKSFKEAPFFYWLYTPSDGRRRGPWCYSGLAKLVRMVILSQVLNGVLLPLVMVFMLLLINRKDLMGEHMNSRWFNAMAWMTAVVVIALSLVMMFAGGRLTLAVHSTKPAPE